MEPSSARFVFPGDTTRPEYQNSPLASNAVMTSPLTKTISLSASSSTGGRFMTSPMRSLAH